MNHFNWAFKQSVTESDMDRAFGWVHEFFRGILTEGRLPWGIASGYTVTADAGLAVIITTGIAYDKYGRRIVPGSGTSVNITADSAGSSNVVSGGGNERWVSIFARGGRAFHETFEDGNGLIVRKASYEVLNNLGEGVHGNGAYNPTLALEAGIDKYLIVGGVEAPVGTALRPYLVDDAVLICDVRLVNGQTAVDISDIFHDRRQELDPGWLRAAKGDQDLYSHADAAPRYGVTQESLIAGGSGGFHLSVVGGRGYIYGPNGGQYQRWDLKDIQHYVHMKPPASVGFNRQDLLVVDETNALRMIYGDASNAPSPPAPAVPVGTVPLAEIRAIGGSEDAMLYPIVRRTFRRLPYPYSTMSGVIEGCRLVWPWNLNSSTVHPPYVKSVRNRIAFDGDVVEFPGGYASNLANGLYAQVDTSASPYATDTADGSRAYYIYACRNQFFHNGTLTSPVILLESMVLPDAASGRPVSALGGPRGSISPNDAILIAIGWVRLSGAVRAPVMSTNDGWFQPMTIDVPTELTGGIITLRGAPNTELVDAARIRFFQDGLSTPSVATIFFPNQASTFLANQTIFFPGAGLTTDVGQHVFPCPAGKLGVTVANGGMYAHPMAWHINLPRIGFGGT